MKLETFTKLKMYTLKLEKCKNTLKNLHYDIEQIKYKNINNDKYENICIMMFDGLQYCKFNQMCN